MTTHTNEGLSFGVLLKAFRRRRHLTQEQLAEALGVHRHAIGRWEQGDFLPKSKALVLELSRLLHLSEQEGRQLLEASLTALAPYWIVPALRNPFFTGREEILSMLQARLSGEQVIALTHSYAVHGLGGIGKTHVALEYAYRHALDYSAVFWIAADSVESITNSFMSIAEVLKLPERQEGEQQRIVSAVQRWLSTHKQWLLIWDNLEELDLLPRFLPSSRQGAVLITTRQQALGTLALGMELEMMGPEEGLLLLVRRAKILDSEATPEHIQQLAQRLPTEYTAAEKLVQEMGGLPLALDQAGAYIEETGCSLQSYLQHYEQRRRELLARRGTPTGDHPHSVVTTLSLSCQRVACHHPAALELLHFLAFLSPDAIPEELLREGASHLGPILGPVAADPAQLDLALAALRTVSLVRRNPHMQTLSVHRLVQAILQESLNEQEKLLWIKRTIAAINAALPNGTYETWRHCERLLPHVLLCANSLSHQTEDLDLADMLRKASRYLLLRSQYELAESLCQQALRIREQVLGPEHPNLAPVLNNLAGAYHEQGKYEQAELLSRRILQIREQALGPEHPNLAPVLNNLALLSCVQGKHEQAKALYERALHICEQGESEHPDVAVSLQGLANVYHAQGKHEQAEALYKRALHICEQIFGTEHPEVAFLLNDLSNMYREQGRYQEAGQLYEQTLAICEKQLGQYHSQTAETLHDFALCYQKQDLLVEAASLFQRALQIREQTIGREHPKTLETRTLYTQLVQQLKDKQTGTSSEPKAKAAQVTPQEKRAAREGKRSSREVPTVLHAQSDPIEAFLLTCCELHPRAYSRASDLWQAYERWKQDAQERFPLSRRAFSAYLKAHGCCADRTKTARIWRGIALVKQDGEN